MMVFVIPRLTDVLAESGAQLPAMTRGLMAVSGFMVHWGWVLLFFGIAAVIGVRVGLRTTEMRRVWDDAKLRVPIFGTIIQSIAVVRFARSFTVLLRGGVDVVPALAIVRDVVGNAAYAALFDATIREVEDGNSITSAFVRSPHIPSMVTQLLTVGEETGQLQSVLQKISEFYVRDVDQRVRNLVTIIEPLIMVVMGVAVGVMVAAVIMPMYSLASQF
jgi:type II secretory pathway component PulF